MFLSNEPLVWAWHIVIASASAVSSGFGHAGELENVFRHLLHLFFYRLTVAYDSLLYLQGRVLVYFDATLCRRHYYNASCLCDIYSCFLIVREIKTFYQSASGFQLSSI